MWRVVLVSRLRCLLLLLVTTMLLSGCKTVDKVMSEINEKSAEYKEAREEKAKQKDYDSLYSDEYEDVKEDLYSEAHGIAKAWNTACAWLTGESKSERWARKHQDEVDSRVHRKANDKKLEEKEEKSKKLSDTTEHLSKFLPLVIIAVIIVLLVLLYLFLSKRSAQKPVRAPRPAKTKATIPENASFNTVNVKYQRVLKDNCDKLGMNYDDVLEQHNGDLVAAVNSTNLQLYRK